MYWRLLSTDPQGARDIVLADKPAISTETDRMDRGMLDQLLLHVGTLSSIYHKRSSTFIRTAKDRYLPDSPALNASTRRHLQTPNGFPAASLAAPLPSTSAPSLAPRPTPPPFPTRQSQASTVHPLDEDDDEQEEGRNNDPYGSLGGAFGEGDEAEMGYAADAPAPKRVGRRGAEEEGLF